MTPPTQERALRTREALLWAGAEVFDEFGYAGAGISRILERAKVTAGALYFHFKSKEGLALAVMSAQPQVIEPRLHSHGLQRLVDITLVWAWELQVNPLLRAGVRLSVEQGSFGMQDASSYLGWTEIMADCLRTAVEEGELLPGTAPEDIAEFLVGACTGVQLYAQLVSNRADLPRRTVLMWRMLLPGIARPETVARIDLDVSRGNAA
ncbi:TetR/AcrR family transcriptional regulator [Streptomyces actinomycinicus]|uniref:TetR/AcrR family transcriptional regulator n=1 Tax=Streptomyces actinomycinicus TaxID=1695166 RepID=A0A937JTB1_9ACTN|nr:ScbR family autoregulator-binding transcription factor [Streptomyces actinomycinicus]MBL1087612.1 TetR/AcrR family transcriptional regulator [Streptomyces actinomycinicus]